MVVHPPKLLTARRVVTLLTALFVSLSSGTNYVFSAYAPQLGHRLRINHTQLNIIALAGNIGVYATAPFWGRIADHRGPRILLAIGFVGLLVGYSGIRWAYDAGLPTIKNPQGETITGSLPSSHLYLLILCGFLSGAGGNGGLVASVNTTAKSFPDSARASATGLVISGFGLSAFLFSTIAHALFPGNTSDFLLLLAFGTAVPMIIGFFILRPVPPEPEHALYERVHTHVPSRRRPSHDVVTSIPRITVDRHDSHTPLLGNFADESTDDLEQAPTSHLQHLHQRPSVELSPTRETRLGAGNRSRSVATVHSVLSQAATEVTPALDATELTNISGRELFKSGDFWLLFSITALLSGTGLMYINNVGSIAQALFASEKEYDEEEAAQWQAIQVSLISVANCAGRVLIGMTADFAKNVFGLRRATCISLVCALFFISQITCLVVDTVQNLWAASILLGLAYGSMFGLFPNITIEWFGLAHFSENWGFISLSPLIGGNIFSIAFGRNLDEHVSKPDDGAGVVGAALDGLQRLATRAGLPSEHLCLAGPECYEASIKMTACATAIAFGLSIWAVVRDRRKAQEVAREHGGAESVIWEEDAE